MFTRSLLALMSASVLFQLTGARARVGQQITETSPCMMECINSAGGNDALWVTIRDCAAEVDPTWSMSDEAAMQECLYKTNFFNTIATCIVNSCDDIDATTRDVFTDIASHKAVPSELKFLKRAIQRREEASTTLKASSSSSTNVPTSTGTAAPGLTSANSTGSANTTGSAVPPTQTDNAAPGLKAPRWAGFLLLAIFVFLNISPASAGNATDGVHDAVPADDEAWPSANNVTWYTSDILPDCAYECLDSDSVVAATGDLPTCIRDGLKAANYTNITTFEDIQTISEDFSTDEEFYETLTRLESCVCTSEEIVKPLATCVLNTCAGNDTAIYNAASVGYKLCAAIFNTTLPPPKELIEDFHITVPSNATVPTNITGVPFNESSTSDSTSTSSSSSASGTASNSGAALKGSVFGSSVAFVLVAGVLAAL